MSGWFDRRTKELLYDKNMLLAEDDVDEDQLMDAFRDVKDSLRSGDTYFKIEAPDGGKPDSQYNVGTVVITEEDRGYLFVKRDDNEDFVDFAMMRMDYDMEEERLEPGVAKLIQFQYDDMADPTGLHQSKCQFYFDLLREAGDRSPEAMVSRLSPDFTPEYDVPEQSDYRYD